METYSSSPHLFSDLNIPVGTKGRLPRHARKLEGLAGEKLEDLGETGKKNAPRSGGRSSEGGRHSERSDRSERSNSGERGGRHGHSRGRSDRPAREGEHHRETAVAADAGQQVAGAADRPARNRTRSRTRRRDGEVVTNNDAE